MTIHSKSHIILNLLPAALYLAFAMKSFHEICKAANLTRFCAFRSLRSMHLCRLKLTLVIKKFVSIWLCNKLNLLLIKYPYNK